MRYHSNVWFYALFSANDPPLIKVFAKGAEIDNPANYTGYRMQLGDTMTLTVEAEDPDSDIDDLFLDSGDALKNTGVTFTKTFDNNNKKNHWTILVESPRLKRRNSQIIRCVSSLLPFLFFPTKTKMKDYKFSVTEFARHNLSVRASVKWHLSVTASIKWHLSVIIASIKWQLSVTGSA